MVLLFRLLLGLSIHFTLGQTPCVRVVLRDITNNPIAHVSAVALNPIAHVSAVALNPIAHVSAVALNPIAHVSAAPPLNPTTGHSVQIVKNSRGKIPSKTSSQGHAQKVVGKAKENTFLLQPSPELSKKRRTAGQTSHNPLSNDPPGQPLPERLLSKLQLTERSPSRRRLPKSPNKREQLSKPLPQKQLPKPALPARRNLHGRCPTAQGIRWTNPQTHDRETHDPEAHVPETHDPETHDPDTHGIRVMSGGPIQRLNPETHRIPIPIGHEKKETFEDDETTASAEEAFMSNNLFPETDTYQADSGETDMNGEIEDLDDPTSLSSWEGQESSTSSAHFSQSPRRPCCMPCNQPQRDLERYSAA
ncbi:unnamed protein product [Cyprideis torosa]|uniref:Uncharacterized protein n=1 Tax=Cyprideis torosa TaxID=163714 RepID=A0A7R8WJX8_9CRUS|nr:unnamed protein product [Cyprideis torosa]CAG0896255.1 unnamed protein product [Cyprideis torosa]